MIIQNMGVYPKHLSNYRLMQSYLTSTNIEDNIKALYSFHKIEMNNFKFGKDSQFGRNLYTAQAIEFLREIIINSVFSESKGMSEINDFNKVFSYYLQSKEPLTIEYLKNSKKNGRTKGDILYSTSHNQFWYQNMNNDMLNHLSYHLSYYKNIDFDKHIKNKVGLDIEKLLLIGYLLYTFQDSNIILNLDSNNNIYKEEINYIIKYYSINLKDLQIKLKEKNKKSNIFSSIKEMEYYGLDILFDKPFIKVSNGYICPIPNLLINRITTAIYYLFVKEKKFRDKLFGNINQAFILGIFLNIKNCNVVDTSNYKYKKNKPNNPDIILYDNNIIFFVENKSLSVKYESIKNGLTIEDKNKIKEHILQLYRSIQYYTNENFDEYFGLKKKENIKIIPIITYINNPFLESGDYLKEILDEIILEGIINYEIINNNYVRIIENSQVIFLANLIENLGLSKIYEEISSDKYKGWEFENIIRDIKKKYNIINKLSYKHDYLNILTREEKILKNKGI